MHACVSMYIYVRIQVYVRVCLWCAYVYGCMFIWVHGLGCVTAFRTRLVRSEPVAGDSDLYSLWTRYTGDSKTDPWDDSEILTDSCSKDQTTIRFQNHALISFSYLSLSVLLTYYLYHFIWLSYIFDQYDHPYHFI